MKKKSLHDLSVSIFTSKYFVLKVTFYFVLFSIPSILNAQLDTINILTTDTLSICQNNTLIVTANNHGVSNPTFSWSNGESDSIITVTQENIYIVTITNNTDTLIDSILIMTDSLINISITDTIILCESAQSIDLLSYHPLGMWSGVGIQNDSFDINIAGGIGVHDVYYNVINGACIDSNLVSLNVRSIPSIILSDDTTTYCNSNQNIIIDSALFSPYVGIWNGNGIINNQAIFNPRLAGGLGYNGSDSIHFVSLEIQDDFGCSNRDSLTFRVIYRDTLIVPIMLGICRFSGLDTLSKYAQISNTTEVIWSGNGIINSTLGIFDPQLSNVDTIQPNIIMVTQGQGSCQLSDMISVSVGLPPVIDAGDDFNICLNAGLDTLKEYIPYTFWSGQGIIDSTKGIFNPQIAGIGLHVLTYHSQNPITNCYVFDELTVNVLPLPNPSISPALDTICNQDNILLSDYFIVSPNGIGGSWFGNGISAPSQGIFSPNNSNLGGIGAGNYILSYAFVDNNFCSDTTEVTIMITDGVVVDAGTDLSICLNDGQVTLQGIPQGGLWNSQLQGLISSSQAVYDPLLVGGGVTDTLIYSFDDGICTNKDTILLSVNNNPIVYVNFNDTICVNNGNYLLSGNYPISDGFWTGSNAVVNSVSGLYNPNLAGQQSDSLYFNYINSSTGCASSALKIITIDTIPNINMVYIDSFYYRDQASVLLSGVPSNGMFYSNQPGITFNNSNYFFNPQSTIGNSTNIYMTYTDNNGCTNADTQNIIIRDRFLDIPTGIVGLGNSAMDWGDYDNDGDLDLIIIGSNSTGRKTLIYQNNNGTFSTDPTINNSFVQVENGDVKWGDYDNDGDLDIAITGNVANSINSTVKVYENRINTSGVFVEDTQVNNSLVGLGNSSLKWGDLDSDGDLDLVVIGKNYSGIGISRIYRNRKNEDGSFSPFPNLTSLHSGGIDIGDYDNDTDMDIIITGYSTMTNSPQTIVYNNNGNQFNAVPTSILPLQDSDVAWGDYDNDGDLDILIVGYSNLSGTRVTNIYENTGGSFTNITIGTNTLQGIDKGEVAWGDYDNDGDLDIIMTGKRNISDPGYTKILRNNIGDTLLPLFTILPVNLISLYGGDVSWVDYDNDGDLDVCQIGSQSNVSNNYFNLYRNRNELNTLNNFSPSAPTNISDTVTLANGEVTLSWTPSFDNSTPSAALSYNVALGRTPSSVENVSPMSDLNTGKRRVVERGNVGKSNFTIFKNLPDGKHYWKVQAIDNNFDGSIFSVIDSFDVRKILIDSLPEVLCAGSTVDVHYTTIATDFFDVNNIFTVELSDTTGSFSNPVILGTLNSDTTGVISITIPENTQNGSYKLRMVANLPLSISLPYVNTITIHPVSGFDIQTNDSLFCDGNSTILTTNYNSTFSYQWKMNDSILSSVDTFIQVFDTALYRVITTTNNNCIDSSDISTGFYPDPFPIFSINDSCLFTTVKPVNNSTISQSGIAQYRWDFGDGTNLKVGFEPDHSYNQVDTFTIKLITESFHGCLDSTTRDIIIHPLPFANFEVDDVCFGENAIFSNDSQQPLYGTIHSFYWDFGDSSFNIVENPIHYFDRSDSFYVNLKATTDYGCTSDTTQKIIIHPLPLPSFSAIESCQRDMVLFDNLSQNILVPIDSSIWTFDDGYFSFDYTPVHAYNIADTFDVNLRITTPFGCEADTTIPLIINPTPESGFYAIGNCTEDYSIQFYDTSSIKWGNIRDYQWYFGDGGQSNDINPLYQYNVDSVYSVTLITESNNSCFDTLRQTIPSLLLPIANFNFRKNPISLGDTLRLVNNSLNVFSYLWNFGDTTITTGTDTSAIKTPKYFYTDYGHYTVSLSVYNELGCEDTLSKIVRVRPRLRSDYEVITYPNPTFDGFVTLNIDLRDTSELNVEVYNVSGKKVWSLVPEGESIRAIPPPDPFDVYKVYLDLSSQGSGLYFLSIIVDGIRYSTTKTITNGPLINRNLDYNHSMKILLIKE